MTARSAFLPLVLLYLVLITFIGIEFDFAAPLSLYNTAQGQVICQGFDIMPFPCWSDIPLDLGSSPDAYLDYFGGSDPGSYVRGAQDLLREDISFFQWTRLGYGTWPPGIFFVNALALELDVPLGMVQWGLAALSWSLALAVAGLVLAKRLGHAVWSLAPGLVVLLPLFSQNFLHYGITWTETSASALLVLGLSVIALPIAPGRSKIALWLVAGIIVALSAYIRAQVYHFTIAFVMVFVLFALIALLTRRFKTRQWLPHLGFFLGFTLTLFPYIDFNSGRLYNVDYALSYPFVIAEYPNAGAANWLPLGGMRSACIANEERCLEVRTLIENQQMSGSALKSEIVGAFFGNPVGFIGHKFPIMMAYFFADNTYPTSTVYRMQIWENLLYLLILLGSMAYLLRQRSVPATALSGLLLLMVAAVIAPPFAMHFEVRYLYLAKIIMLFSPMLALAAEDIAPLRARHSGEPKSASHPLANG